MLLNHVNIINLLNHVNIINLFSHLLTPNFSLQNTYKIRHLVMRKFVLIKQKKLLKVKSKILSNMFSEKYGLK